MAAEPKGTWPLALIRQSLHALFSGAEKFCIHTGDTRHADFLFRQGETLLRQNAVRFTVEQAADSLLRIGIYPWNR